MIPGNSLSSAAVQAPFAEPANDRTTPLVDVEMGGLAISDPSAGLRLKLWCARYETGDVIISADGAPDQVLFSRAGITELSLAFDQNMNPFIAFNDTGGSAYWWFDSTVGGMAFAPYLPAGSVNLRCTLDEKRPGQSGNSDVILAYMRAGGLYYRQQRDRFGIEYLLQNDAGGALVNVGMNRQNRLQFRVVPGTPA